MSGALADLFARTLSAIRSECPTAWRELLRESSDLDIGFAFDGERFTVRGTGRDLRVEHSPRESSIRVEASVDALKQLILGERGVVDSIERDEIFVAGDPHDLVRLDRLTWLAVAGAARTESAGPLLEELLEHSPKSKRTNGRGGVKR